MATYGIDYYDKAFYGAPVLINYAVTNLAAAQLDFGHVRISWTAPVANVWTDLALVRSRYGFPLSPSDGDLLATYSSTQASTSYDDYELTSGYWYYGLFAAVPLQAWSATMTYQAGDRVAYSSQNWIAQQLSTDVTPAAGAYWALSNETALWQGAGAVATMSISDHGYAALLNSYVPGAYKTTPILTTDDEVVNDDLADFLAVLGWGFEIMNTESDDLYHLYDTSTTRLDRLLEISQMLGISIEAASSARYQRLRTARAASLGRAKGTAAGLAALVEAATGLVCTVATGPNLMLKRDQSDFPWPLYPAWESDESYKVGDLVTYQGARFECITWALTPTFTGSPNTAGSFTTPAPYVAENSATLPSQLSASIAAPVTGVYELIVITMNGPANAQVEVDVDGAAVTLCAPGGLTIGPSGFSFNLGATTYGYMETYASTQGTGNHFLAGVYLTAGTHTLTFRAISKSSSSTGYDVQIASAVLSAAWTQYPPSATVPTNAGTSAGLEWAAQPATAQPGYANAQTGQVSTWTISGASNAVLDIAYLGRIGLTTDVNWLQPVNGPFTLNGVYTLTCAAYPVIAAYSNTTAYVPGQIVTGPTDSLQYTALLATTGNAPPDPGVWRRSNYASPYDRVLIAQSSTPIHPPPLYDPQAAYPEGALVQYNAGLYSAPAPATRLAPPASPGSNAGWSYLGPAAGGTWAVSYYNPEPTTGTTTLYPGMVFYDQSGQPICAPSLMNSAGSLISTLPVYGRLIEPVGELNGAYLETGQQISATPTGAWQISSGAAAVTPTYGGSTKLKLLYVATGMTNTTRVGITFVTEVANPSVRDVGLVFRLSDTGNYFIATRSKIALVSGGTPATLASYTRLPTGTRIFVDMSGSTLALYAYPGASAAPTLITTVTNSANSTASDHGIVDWTF